MDNQKDHINPWAKKLEEAANTENDGWSSMELMLDRNMPVQKRKEARRWILTTIFLFLLIGVCNCPAIRTSNSITRNNSRLTNRDSIRNQSQQSFTSKNSSAKKHFLVPADQTNPGTSAFFNEKKYNEHDRNRNNNLSSVSSKGIKAGKNNKSKDPITQAETDQQIIAEVQSATAKDSPARTTTTSKGDSSRTDLHTNAKTIGKTKTESTPKKTSEKIPEEDKKGFVLTLGLNQFFPVGMQDKTNYNSNGTTGGISDYIPVPAGRYYFHNWLYLEAELQINSPQYTNSLLVDQKIGYPPGQQPLVQSVFIRKLFYFNVPVSIHFSPVKNLFIGAGIQYSHLTNGVSLYQESTFFGTFTPMIPINDTTLIYSEVRDFKHDTSYQKLKTDEWRFLLDVNYQWKRLTLGLRYNQAFNNFINIQVSANTVTQAHNSSLQLYLQYMLWDNRKKIKKPNP